LGRLTHETVCEMTLNVSSGTLSRTIPYLEMTYDVSVGHYTLWCRWFKRVENFTACLKIS